MTGARISFTLDIKEFQQRVDRLGGVLRSGTMKAIGVGLVKVTQERFEEEREPLGARWKPLNALYASGKKGSGILKNKGMAGGLMGSITDRVTIGTVIIGTNKIYAAVHQFGATIKPVNARSLVFRLGRGKGSVLVHAHQVTIPARPYLGFGPLDQRELLEVVDGEIKRTLGGP